MWGVQEQSDELSQGCLRRREAQSRRLISGHRTLKSLRKGHSYPSGCSSRRGTRG